MLESYSPLSPELTFFIANSASNKDGSSPLIKEKEVRSFGS